MSLDINQIYLGDARELLRQIEPNSIALNGNNIRGGKYNTQTRVHLVGGVVDQQVQMPDCIFMTDASG